MGWSPEGEEEILDQKQIADSFTLERVSRSPAVFDLDKLNWVNQQYVKRLDTQELYNRLQPFIAATSYARQVELLSSEQVQWLMQAVRERMVCLKDIEQLLPIFFDQPIVEAEAQEVLSQPGVKQVLQTLWAQLPSHENPDDRSAAAAECAGAGSGSDREGV